MEEPIAEHDVVVSLVETVAHLIGEETTRLVEAGTAGAVVLVHRENSRVVAYEVEFHLGGDAWGLATLSSEEVDKPSNGRLYHAIVDRNSPGTASLRVAVCAKDLADAKQKLEAQYGGGAVFNLHNREDAARPR
jgi:hypothetical protein